MFGRSPLFLLALTAVVCAVPTPEYHVVHEKRGSLSSAWIKRDRLPRKRYLPMRIGLTQSELENAEYHLMSVSHPDSPNYGEHWDLEKVIDTFRPSHETEHKVRQWLIDSGIELERIGHSTNKAWFTFHATVEDAEALLATEFHEYEHIESGGIVPSCEQYHLPKHISPHVDYITPGIHLPTPAKKRRQVEKSVSRSVVPPHLRDYTVAGPTYDKSNLSVCDTEITPACIAALYGIPATSGSIQPNNSLGIYTSNLQFYVQSDLDAFFTNYTNIPNGTHPNGTNIDGGAQSFDSLGYAGGEITLDLSIAYPIVYPQNIVNYDVDDFVYQTGLEPSPTIFEGFDTFLDALDGSFCDFTAYNQTGNGPYDPVYPDPYGGWQGELECGTVKPASVISVSYGTQEVDLFLSDQKRQCLEYLKLGLQGVSILFASGDAGVANFLPGYATGTPGCMGTNGDIFNPRSPNTCPWVTSVGATRIFPGHTVTDAESAMSRPSLSPAHAGNYSSGGGFSNIYTSPDYQKSAIDTYFQEHDPGYPYYSKVALNTDNITKYLDPDYLAGDTGGIYNRIGRGYPDVSANGYGAALVLGGAYAQELGTSMSTPIFASVINRINEERLKAGKKHLGFLNPSLYANPSMLNDITNGLNLGCTGADSIGFNATTGWDPVTGLGTPNYPKMLEYYMSLP